VEELTSTTKNKPVRKEEKRTIEKEGEEEGM